MLAAACEARAADSVLDLGCGVGVASLCLSARVADLRLVGVEIQAEYADLARRNVAEAGQQIQIVNADLNTLPADIQTRGFDHVIANPPFFRSTAGHEAPDPGRGAARHDGATPLSAWIGTARRRLAPKGVFTVILPAARLAELLHLLDGGFGGIAIRPIAPRAGREAGRVIVRAQKGARAPLRLLAPLILHDGPRHLSDAEDLTDRARAILRGGDPIPWTTIEPAV
ncbi:MAG: methyltransferase [Pseudomonadota bacterium]